MRSRTILGLFCCQVKSVKQVTRARNVSVVVSADHSAGGELMSRLLATTNKNNSQLCKGKGLTKIAAFTPEDHMAVW